MRGNSFEAAGTTHPPGPRSTDHEPQGNSVSEIADHSAGIGRRRIDQSNDRDDCNQLAPGLATRYPTTGPATPKRASPDGPRRGPTQSPDLSASAAATALNSRASSHLMNGPRKKFRRAVLVPRGPPPSSLSAWMAWRCVVSDRPVRSSLTRRWSSRSLPALLQQPIDRLCRDRVITRSGG